MVDGGVHHDAHVDVACLHTSAEQLRKSGLRSRHARLYGAECIKTARGSRSIVGANLSDLLTSFDPGKAPSRFLLPEYHGSQYNRRVCGLSSSARMKQLSRDLQMETVKVVGRTYLLDISIEHGSRLPRLPLRVNVSEPGMVRC